MQGEAYYRYTESMDGCTKDPDGHIIYAGQHVYIVFPADGSPSFLASGEWCAKQQGLTVYEPVLT